MVVERAIGAPGIQSSEPVNRGRPEADSPQRAAFARALKATAAALAKDGDEAGRKRAEAWETKRPKVTFHSLRHTAASLMVAAGIPLLDVARILGHSTLAVTMRYAHFAPQSGRAAIEALAEALRTA